MSGLTVEEQIKSMMIESGAWLQGHFRLTSGRHSGNYMQCAMMLRYPKKAAFAGAELAKLLRPLEPDFIVSPALGGLIIGHEVARALDVPFLFCEREAGAMRLRRFPAPEGKKFVVVEDVITTGGSLKETAVHVASLGCRWVGSACIVDRSGGDNVIGPSLISLMKISFPTYEESECPLCASLGTPPVKPGSRDLSK
ncbi:MULTISPECIES: orotate phosphoribosyltransferase [Jonquetella]|uniref:Orotate phosphoribosyltransferase n=1 Tax=Jonquetella anthropi DSM 22815 TaxID=885272 RepID=H0UJJ9_9BACT|nr:MULTISPECIES: orotate phosphoribosyltransferase [Jonquetella]EEX48850.1 orotate phosphoribosyltransferase [Jonquetella anthropi E3_33 E1]EHM12867.1 orotate phosphoribosyltransferase [Jonquetella anthropi DSM 22815]ERL24063.1 orotate phosphoribosyltransferase [Jonquetella sp. BV3C21]